MSEAGGMTSTDYRLGFHKPIGRPWRPVIYSAVDINGTLYAVIDGCILIGSVEQQDAIVARIRANGNAAILFTDPDAALLGGAIKGESFRWKNRLIPYEIAATVPRQERIATAVDHWNTKTQLRLKPRNGEADWIRFVPASGCSSYIGRQGGMQEIFIGDGCSAGNMIHEIGHAVGFYHEQSRSDRDSFVEIKWASVAPTMRHNFNQEDSLNLGNYDYGSIMHYPATAFSVDGQPTIVAKQALPPGVVMGQRNGLSASDIAAVAQLYP